MLLRLVRGSREHTEASAGSRRRLSRPRANSWSSSSDSARSPSHCSSVGHSGILTNVNSNCLASRKLAEPDAWKEHSQGPLMQGETRQQVRLGELPDIQPVTLMLNDAHRQTPTRSRLPDSSLTSVRPPDTESHAWPTRHVDCAVIRPRISALTAIPAGHYVSIY
jgi:hypothetical protein